MDTKAKLHQAIGRMSAAKDMHEKHVDAIHKILDQHESGANDHDEDDIHTVDDLKKLAEKKSEEHSTKKKGKM